MSISLNLPDETAFSALFPKNKHPRRLMDLDFILKKDLKAADYYKAFLNKTLWRKAEYVILLTEHALGGKKITVALPFKKRPDFVAAFKRIKKERIRPLNKVALGSISIESDEDEDGEGEGAMQARISLLRAGKAKPELIEPRVRKLFDRIRCELVFVQDEGKGNEDLEEDENPDTIGGSPKNKKTQPGNKSKQPLTEQKPDETPKESAPLMSEEDPEKIPELMDRDKLRQMDEDAFRLQQNPKAKPDTAPKVPTKEEIRIELKDLYYKTEALCKKLGLDLNAFKK